MGFFRTAMMGPRASAVRRRVGGFLSAVSGVCRWLEGFLNAVSGVRRWLEGFLNAVSGVPRWLEGFRVAVSDVRDGETGFFAATGAGGLAGATCSRLALGAGVSGTIIVVTTGLRLAGGSGAGAGAALTEVEGGAVPVSTNESVWAITKPLLRILNPLNKLSPSISRGDR